MIKRYWPTLLVLFILTVLSHAYWQYNQLVIDGDLVAIAAPSAWYRTVLNDPFGWAVLTKNAVYAAPNRFFAHWLLTHYFKTVPLWLHAFTDPVQSVYTATALLKLGVQIMLLYLLGHYATGLADLRRQELWIVMALLLPLFQTAGFNSQMGIIDHAVTYVIFYALPLVLLLLVLLPFYQAAQRNAWQPLSGLKLLGVAALMVILSFNGPVVTGVVAILLPGILVYWLQQQHKSRRPLRLAVIPWQPAVLLIFFGSLCLYSLYIGRNNSENLEATLSLWERYKILPVGFYQQFTRKPGLPLLVAMTLLNAWLIRRAAPSAKGNQLLRAGRYLSLFILLYLLLLPLGGYRSYRPQIVRRDVLLPAVLGVVCFYGASAFYLVRHLPLGRVRQQYLGALGVFSAIFLTADMLPLRSEDLNICERQALQQLARAPTGPVLLTQSCNLLSWNPINTPNDSRYQAYMLHYWGITQRPILYYQAPTPTSP